MLLTISSNEIGVNTGISSTATESSEHIPLAVTFPSPPPKTSDSKIVRQLFGSINKSAAPYISSLVTLSVQTDGVTNTLYLLECFGKLVCMMMIFSPNSGCLLQLSEDLKSPWAEFSKFPHFSCPILIPCLLPCV